VRFDMGEDFGTVPRGRRKGGSCVAFDALDTSVDDINRGIGPGRPLMSAF